MLRMCKVLVLALFLSTSVPLSVSAETGKTEETPVYLDVTANEQVDAIHRYLAESPVLGALAAANALRDTDSRVQRYALEVLERYGTQEVLASVQLFAEESKNSILKHRAEALSARLLLQDVSDLDRVITYLEQHLDDSTHEVRQVLEQELLARIEAHPENQKLRVLQKNQEKKHGPLAPVGEKRDKHGDIQQVQAGESLRVTYDSEEPSETVKVEIVNLLEPNKVLFETELQTEELEVSYVWETPADLPVGLYQVSMKESKSKQSEPETFTAFVSSTQTAGATGESLASSNDTYEPNNDFSTATTNGGTPGTVRYSYLSTPIDQDYFSLYSSNTSGLVTITLKVPALVNYDLWLYDADGKVLLGSTNGTGLVEKLEYRITTGRYYYVRVTSPDGTFDETNSYSLSFSTLNTNTDSWEVNDTFASAKSFSGSVSSEFYWDLDVDYYKYTATKTGMSTITLTVPPGEDYDFELYDKNQTLINTAATLNTSATLNTVEQINAWLTAGESYYFKVYGKDQAKSNYSYRLTVPVPAVDTYEWNDRPEYAKTVEPGHEVLSYLSVTGDVDYYSFTAVYDDVLQMTLTPPTASTLCAAVFSLQSDGSLLLVTELCPPAGEAKSINISVALNQTYLIKVIGIGSYSMTAPYKLQMPDYSLESYEANDTSDQAVEIKHATIYRSYLNREDDTDWYRVLTPSTVRNHLTVKVPEGSSYQVRIFDVEMNEVTSKVSDLGQALELEFRATTGKTYWIQIKGADVLWSKPTPYSMRLSEIRQMYEYDAANRLNLISVQKGFHVQQMQFLYDENGNLINRRYSEFEKTE